VEPSRAELVRCGSARIWPRADGLAAKDAHGQRLTFVVTFADGPGGWFGTVIFKVNAFVKTNIIDHLWARWRVSPVLKLLHVCGRLRCGSGLVAGFATRLSEYC